MPDPVITLKKWGNTERVRLDATVEIARARIVPGGYSSLHRHRRKHNYFIVLSGELEITHVVGIEDLGVDETLRYVLKPGDNLSPLTVVAADRWHRFKALTHVDVLEVYTSADGSPVDPDDIERQDEGGVDLESVP